MSVILSEDIACNLCGAHNHELVYASSLVSTILDPDKFRCTSSAYGVHPPIVRCRECGLVYASPRWEETAVHDSYAVVEDPMYVEEREGRVLTFFRDLKPFETLVGANSHTRRLLDVGCHVGVMVECAQRRGWDAWGVEPSIWAAERARACGLHVITGTLDDADLEEDYFDVVTIWDVIEHLTDPIGELKKVRRVLKPGGILAVHTMDIESLVARLMGKRWPWLMEMHLYYFSPRTLGKMMSKAGYSVIRSSPEGRYLRLGYLATRLEPYSGIIGRGLLRLLNRLNIAGQAVRVNFGDIFTIYARKE